MALDCVIKLTTETKVALDLSPISFNGESPVAIFGFFLGLKKIVVFLFIIILIFNN